MKNRLPVDIENNELPFDKYNHEENRSGSYGYVSVLYLFSLIITIGSILTIIFLGR